MASILQEIINLLVGGLTAIAEGIGDGLAKLVEGIFVNVETTGGTTTYSLTTFGSVVIIFAGVSLAIGLCRWVTNWITSLGASN